MNAPEHLTPRQKLRWLLYERSAIIAEAELARTKDPRLAAHLRRAIADTRHERDLVAQRKEDKDGD